MPLIGLLCLGWTLGIWLAAQFGLGWPAWLGWAALMGGGLLLLKARRLGGRRAHWALAAVAALGLGGLRYQLAQPVFDQRFLASHNDLGTVTLEGVVWDLPDVRDTRTNLRLRVDSLRRVGDSVPIEVHGLALVYAPRFSDSRLAITGDGEFQYGDRVRVTGALETPPEFDDFSYKDYLARQGVHSQVRLAQVTFLDEREGHFLWQALFDIKRRALGVLAQIFPEPHASLLAGILLGVESGIPADMQAAFAATGTSHIVAISGFNIAIVAGLFAVIASRLFGPRRGLWIAILGVAAYTVLAGASASVVRAAIMGSLALLAQQIGRRGAGLNTLAAAVGLMTLANPLTLWDVGFQLSAAATLGLIVYAEPLQLGFSRLAARFTSAEAARRLTAALGESLLLTLAAQLTTLPLMMYYFRSLSLISLLANAAILPAQPAVMILAGLALLLGLAWLPLGKLAAWAAWPFSAYTVRLVYWFGDWPGASIGLGQMAPWFLAGSYALLFGLTWLLRRPAEQRPAWLSRPLLERLAGGGLVSLAVGAALAWSGVYSLPEPGGRLLRVSVLDVGQGDGVLIVTPSGVQVLVDGGPSGSRLVRALGRELPLFSRQLDVLVVAGPRDENVGGLPDVLARYRVLRAVVTGAPGKSAAYQAVLDGLRDHSIATLPAGDLPALDLGDGVWLRVLADGEQGSVLRLDWQRASIVLPIGLDLSGETALLARGLVQPATALLLGDHGSEKVTQERWVWAVDPQVVFVSIGAGQGGPSPEVLGRLAGRTILRTDEHGTLTLLSDGQHVWVETER